MKALAVTTLFTLFSLISSAQLLEPVKWDFEVKSMEDGSYEFIAKAKIDDKWSIYSQHTGEGGPIPLEFTYEAGVQLDGSTKEESKAIKKMSKLFEVEVIKFEKEAIFIQRFKPETGTSSIKGYLTFMCCDELRCLPPTDVDFDVAL